jgi:hypothetical protein
MSSGQATDEMAALRNKIASLSLEVKMNMQRVKRDNQAAWQKRDGKTGKKELKMKMEIRSLAMQTALENERRDRKDLEQKMELMKMQAMIEVEKRDRYAEKKDLEHKQALENEKQDRLLENERRDRKDLEQKMEIMKVQTAHALENEKRDRMLENEKRDRMLENEKRDRMLENEKRDRDAALATKETQHQIEQLKLEARIGQMEQQQRHYSQPIVTSSLVQPIQHLANPSPAQQGEREQWLLQQLQEQQSHKNESSQPQQLSIPFPGHAVPSMSQEGVAAPLALASISSPPAVPQDAVAATVATSIQGNTGTITGFQSAQPGTRITMALPSVPKGSTGSSVPLPSAARQQPSSTPKQDRSIAAKKSGSHAPAATPPKEGRSTAAPGQHRASSQRREHSSAR